MAHSNQVVSAVADQVFTRDEVSSMDAPVASQGN